MFSESPTEFQPFTRTALTERYQTNLPHWRQPGTTYFVTFRLKDSIPDRVLAQWEAEKISWLKENRIVVPSPIRLEAIPEKLRFSFEREFNRKLNVYLDAGHGACHLRDPAVRDLLIDRLAAVPCPVGDFVIMPNPVHALLTPEESLSLEETLHFLKGGSARIINQHRGLSGPLWQKDSFDHIVRHTKSLETYQQYIAENPGKAGLKRGEYSVRTATYISV